MSLWLEMNDILAVRFVDHGRFDSMQELWRDIPVLAIISDDRDRFPVVSGKHSNYWSTTLRLE